MYMLKHLNELVVLCPAGQGDRGWPFCSLSKDCSIGLEALMLSSVDLKAQILNWDILASVSHIFSI